MLSGRDDWTHSILAKLYYDNNSTGTGRGVRNFFFRPAYWKVFIMYFDALNTNIEVKKRYHGPVFCYKQFLLKIFQKFFFSSLYDYLENSKTKMFYAILVSDL